MMSWAQRTDFHGRHTDSRRRLSDTTCLHCIGLQHRKQRFELDRNASRLGGSAHAQLMALEGHPRVV